MNLHDQATAQAVDLAIRALRFKLADALNRRNVDAYLDAFMPDGVWTAGGSDQVGHAAIRQRLEQGLARHEWLVQIYHDAAVLEVTDGGVRARAYCTEHGSVEGQPKFLSGVYDELAVRHNSEWRFAHRSFTLIYNGPPDLTATGVSPAR